MLLYGMFWFTLLQIVVLYTLQVENGYVGFTKDYYSSDDDNWKTNRPTLDTDDSKENVRSSYSTYSQDAHLPIHRHQSDDFIFKIQRDSEGKLNVVYNNSYSEIKTTDDNLPLVTNPVRRSTTTVIRPSVIVTTTQSSYRRRDQGDIIFPDDVEKNIRRRQQQPKIAPKCLKSIENFCVEVENYPMAHVQAALTSTDLNKYASLFGDDVIITTPTSISERIDGGGEESLCHSVEKLIYPQAGLTKDNNWTFIVNQDNYTQGIRIEECTNPGKPCSMSDLFPNGVTTECRQSYIHRQLLSINSEGKVAKDLFRLPSCCKCIIKSSHRFRRNSIFMKN